MIGQKSKCLSVQLTSPLGQSHGIGRISQAGDFRGHLLHLFLQRIEVGYRKLHFGHGLRHPRRILLCGFDGHHQGCRIVSLNFRPHRFTDGQKEGDQGIQLVDIIHHLLARIVEQRFPFGFEFFIFLRAHFAIDQPHPFPCHRDGSHILGHGHGGKIDLRREGDFPEIQQYGGPDVPGTIPTAPGSASTLTCWIPTANCFIHSRVCEFPPVSCCYSSAYCRFFSRRRWAARGFGRYALRFLTALGFCRFTPPASSGISGMR